MKIIGLHGLPEKPKGSRPLGILKLLLGVVIILFGLFQFVFIPLYIKYVKSYRMDEAKSRVESIYGALEEWRVNPELGGGSYPLGVGARAKDEKMFSEHFPEEARWLKAGSAFYQYAYDQGSRADGTIVLKVTATPTDIDNVFDFVVEYP